MHSSKQLKEAEARYKQALLLEPTNCDALHQLGALLVELYGRTEQIDEAIKLVKAAIQRKPAVAKYRNTLGVVYERSEQYWEAVEAYQHAVDKEPHNTKFIMNLARAMREVGRLASAAELYRRASALEPHHRSAHIKRASILHKLGRKQEAVEAYRAHLHVVPGHVSASFWLAALTGDPGGRACPPSMVASLFDQYADRFDEHLVERLEYRTPQHLMDALLGVTGPDVHWGRCVDLGCGTGLMGPLLRSRVRCLEGVDLSSGMVAKARERGCYDRLCVGEIVTFLAGEADALLEQQREQQRGGCLCAGRGMQPGLLGKQACEGGDGDVSSTGHGSAGGDLAQHPDTEPNSSSVDGVVTVKAVSSCGPFTGPDVSSSRSSNNNMSNGTCHATGQTVAAGDLARPGAISTQTAEPPHTQCHVHGTSSVGCEPYDLLAAADVFVYIGDLQPVFEAASRVVRPGALLSFSTERLSDRGPARTSLPAVVPERHPAGYELQATGRYVHAAWYVSELAELCGWRELHSSSNTLRMNAGEPVWGNLVVLKYHGK